MPEHYHPQCLHTTYRAVVHEVGQEVGLRVEGVRECTKFLSRLLIRKNALVEGLRRSRHLADHSLGPLDCAIDDPDGTLQDVGAAGFTEPGMKSKSTYTEKRLA